MEALHVVVTTLYEAWKVYEPQIQDYITRAQVAEAAELAAGFRTPFAEFRADKGHWPTTIGAQGSAASIEGTITGKYSGVTPKRPEAICLIFEF